MDDVYDWILAAGGNAESAQAFRDEVVDGAALLLLNDAYMHSIMGLKLGPAVKIKAALQQLRRHCRVSTATADEASVSMTRAD